MSQDVIKNIDDLTYEYLSALVHIVARLGVVLSLGAVVSAEGPDEVAVPN